MKYKEIRSEIKNGDVLAWRGTGIWGNLIRAWTRDKYSHVGMAYWINGHLFVLEAKEGRGIIPRRLSLCAPFYWGVIEGSWNQHIEKSIVSHIGEKYSFLAAIFAGLGLALKMDDNWQCAEWVNFTLQERGIAIDSGATTPGSLVEEVMLTCNSQVRLVTND